MFKVGDRVETTFNGEKGTIYQVISSISGIPSVSVKWDSWGAVESGWNVSLRVIYDSPEGVWESLLCGN